jgi:hypothetical protein
MARLAIPSNRLARVFAEKAREESRHSYILPWTRGGLRRASSLDPIYSALNQHPQPQRLYNSVSRASYMEIAPIVSALNPVKRNKYKRTLDWLGCFLSGHQAWVVKRWVDDIITGLQPVDINRGIAGEIHRFIVRWDNAGKRRIHDRLAICQAMYQNADYLMSCIEPESRSEVLRELDQDLKAPGSLVSTHLCPNGVAGSLLGGEPNYDDYAEHPDALREYARDVLNQFQRRWRIHRNQQCREDFISYIFEHDKGYASILQDFPMWDLIATGAIDRPERIKRITFAEYQQYVGGTMEEFHQAYSPRSRA